MCGQDGTLLYEEQIDGACPFGEYKYATAKRAGVSIKEEIEKVWKNVTTLSVHFMAYACTPDDYNALRGAVTNYIPTFSKSFPLQAGGLAMNLVLQSYTTRSQLLRRKPPTDAMETIEAGSDVVAAVLQLKDDQWTVIRAAIGMGSYLEAQDKLIEKLK